MNSKLVLFITLIALLLALHVRVSKATSATTEEQAEEAVEAVEEAVEGGSLGVQKGAVTSALQEGKKGTKAQKQGAKAQKQDAKAAKGATSKLLAGSSYAVSPNNDIDCAINGDNPRCKGKKPHAGDKKCSRNTKPKTPGKPKNAAK